MAKIKVYEDRCIGAGICVAECVEAFDQNDDDGTVVLLLAEIGDELLPAVQSAARACPTQAIEIEG